MMYPDTAQITPVTRNTKTGTETKGVPVTVRCYWEESERLMYKSDGTPWRRENLYFLPVDTAVSEGDYIKPLTRGGFAVVGVDAKVMSKDVARGLPHIEVAT
jgi:hypothetical protein